MRISFICFHWRHQHVSRCDICDHGKLLGRSTWGEMQLHNAEKIGLVCRNKMEYLLGRHGLHQTQHCHFWRLSLVSKRWHIRNGNRASSCIRQWIQLRLMEIVEGRDPGVRMHFFTLRENVRSVVRHKWHNKSGEGDLLSLQSDFFRLSPGVYCDGSRLPS